jgi:hypothetical protein
MDFFGIGAAVKGAVNIYFRSARATGRTTNLLEGLKDGDRVYFATHDEAQYFKRKCKEVEKSIECVVIPISYPEKVFERGTSQGRAVFDHGWIEQFYINALEQCTKDIKHLETETSGYGEAHRETKRKAIEFSKWQF